MLNKILVTLMVLFSLTAQASEMSVSEFDSKVTDGKFYRIGGSNARTPFTEIADTIGKSIRYKIHLEASIVSSDMKKSSVRAALEALSSRPEGYESEHADLYDVLTARELAMVKGFAEKHDVRVFAMEVVQKVYGNEGAYTYYIMISSDKDLALVIRDTDHEEQ